MERSAARLQRGSLRAAGTDPRQVENAATPEGTPRRTKPRLPAASEPRVTWRPSSDTQAGMRLSQLLTVEAARIVSMITSKKRLFKTLSEAAAQAYGCPPMLCAGR